MIPGSISSWISKAVLRAGCVGYAQAIVAIVLSRAYVVSLFSAKCYGLNVFNTATEAFLSSLRVSAGSSPFRPTNAYHGSVTRHIFLEQICVSELAGTANLRYGKIWYETMRPGTYVVQRRCAGAPCDTPHTTLLLMTRDWCKY